MKPLTDVRYWEEHAWGAQGPKRLRWLYRDQDHEIFRLLRQATGKGPKRILEIGAGGSRMLPYLGRKLGQPVAGTDFSLLGCRLLRANLKLQRVQGDVVCDDLFRSSLREASFDVVYSTGLVEHFDDLQAAVAAHLRLVKHGGRLIVTAPNLEGVQGKLFKRHAPGLWQRHVVFGPEKLATTFDRLGLDEIRSGYLGSFFLHLGRTKGWTTAGSWPTCKKNFAYWSVRCLSGSVSLVCRILPWRPHSRAFSPSLFAMGIKP